MTHLWETFATLANSVLDVVMRVINFLCGLVDTIIDLGMWIMGTLGSTIASTVSAVVHTIVDAFNAFVQWAIQTIQIHDDYENKKIPR